MLPLLNLLFRRASCLNRMILTKIINSSVRAELTRHAALCSPLLLGPHSPLFHSTPSSHTPSPLTESCPSPDLSQLHLLLPQVPVMTCSPFKSLFGLSTSSFRLPPAHHLPTSVRSQMPYFCPASFNLLPPTIPQTPAPQPAAFPPQCKLLATTP